jgi:hypothetical protein
MISERYLQYLQTTMGKFGLTVSAEASVTFHCEVCGQQWTPVWQDGRWQYGYRKCPNGCNWDLLAKGD